MKPYVKQHKNDATDAEAIFAAVSRPNMRFVATKTPGQQSCLTDARKQIKGRTVPQSPFAENNGARAKKLAVLPIYHDRSARWRQSHLTERRSSNNWLSVIAATTLAG